MERLKWLVLCFFIICLALMSEEEKGSKENLLKNPTFQDGFAGWQSWASSDTPPLAGLKIDNKNGADDTMCVYMQGFSGAGCIYQCIQPVQYGARYKLKFQFKTEMKTGQAIGEIRYQTAKEINPALWYQTKDAKWSKSEPISGTLTGWKTCEIEIVVPEDQNIKAIVPFISVTKQSPEDKFYIDAVEFYIVK
ncbi:MAG: carbohydrate binding domain-containing protein [Candidatus Omnitrophica bacterium]|nr:carbohydrate binding domain-containing protein [Candidatus Omnitrophota bacterium]